MIEIIDFNDKSYPKFQSSGFAARFIFPFAIEVCKGVGCDVGCGRKEWALPGAIPVDPILTWPFDANNLPQTSLDYVFSSHCLEHLEDWYGVLDYWTLCLRPGGILFLYLPHYAQEYWRPWNNRKHCNAFTPTIIRDAMDVLGYEKVFVSERDLNHSFAAMGQKA